MANMSDKEIRLECIKLARDNNPAQTHENIMTVATDYWLLCLGYDPTKRIEVKDYKQETVEK